ncbi:spore morphogenesis/germination protein YwcE [Aquibacillus kalidii]|uniref:spore morphogenesis/germination protein YwcE n=1 Tax=Aquibacillus kalidii TaxID=2762597 RepID=UPI001647096A|nr:spore morphogenesis/germination protein YwcE [Aquibacillus kalidii]
MDVLLIFLLIFSVTPLVLWADNWKKTAIVQIPLVLGSWFVFMKFVTTGIDPSQFYLWIIFYGNILYGHIAFTIMLLEARKSLKLRGDYLTSRRMTLSRN